MALSRDMSSSQKRKRENGQTQVNFKEDWEEQYLFIHSQSSKPICLICFEAIAVLKKYNLQRHFDTLHNAFSIKYPFGSTLRKGFISKQKVQLASQKTFFVKQQEEMQTMMKASFQISLLLAKNNKSYSDGEIVKDCLSIFAESTGDLTVKRLSQNIALSRNTVMRRVDEMATDVSKQILVASAISKYFSIAIDESCDVTDNAQLLIYIRCVNENFDVVQDLLGLCQLQTSTTGSDIFETLKNCIEKININLHELCWDKLDSICTDGAPAMVGKHIGCVSLLEKYLQRKLFKYHCIIHQEVLCSKDMEFSHVIETAVKCINKIRARALHRREFRNLFENETNEHGELLLHCSVRWLSKGKMLSRFFELQTQVLQFLEAKEELPKECDLLKNNTWKCDLAFLVDVTNYLNILNKGLQGENSLFPTLFNQISAFKAKLQLFANCLGQKN